MKYNIFLLYLWILACPEIESASLFHFLKDQIYSTKRAFFNSDGSAKRLPPGPPSEPPYTLVLQYDDFGPPSLSHELLGPEWWQWERGGSWEIDDSFDVRIVVFRNKSREEVEKYYPTKKNTSDYRYVSYEDAIRFLDHALHDLEFLEHPKLLEEADDYQLLRDTRNEWQKTREKIITALGAP